MINVVRHLYLLYTMLAHSLYCGYRGARLDIIHLKYQNVLYTNITDIFAWADRLA